MRVKKIIYTSSEINTTNGTLKPVYIDVEVEGQNVNIVRKETIRKYPISMSLINTTGQDIEIAIISNEKEENEFLENPDNFYFLVPKDSSIGSSTKIGKMYKVAVRKANANVSSSLRIDFFNHIGVHPINEQTIVS